MQGKKHGKKGVKTVIGGHPRKKTISGFPKKERRMVGGFKKRGGGVPSILKKAEKPKSGGAAEVWGEKEKKVKP